MWKLLQPPLATMVSAVETGQDLARVIVSIKGKIAITKQLLDEVVVMMSKVSEKGYEDLPEYQDALVEYQELSHVVTDLSKTLRDYEARQTQAERAAQLPAGGSDWSGIKPIKATLGYGGHVGIVSSGPEIVNLQKFLEAAGFPVAESGEFDLRTRQALQQFQKKFQLGQDGTVGATTRRVINDMIQGK